jgi:membrane protease YdiL (CAAX protease family)
MNAITSFIAISYALSIGLSLVIGLTGGSDSQLIGLGYATMFFPAMALVIVRTATGARLQIDWDRLPLKYVPVALFLMPLVMHAAMLPTATALEGGPGELHWRLPPGWGDVSPIELAGHIVINAIVGVTVVSALAFFEEIGWRAWLQPQLVERGLGPRGAILATAAISTLWHVPYALSGIHHLAGASTSRAAIAIAIGIFGAALILGWLWVRTGSIWIVSLAHGALNNWGQYAFKYLKDFLTADQALVVCAGSLALLATGALLVTYGTTHADLHRGALSASPRRANRAVASTRG